jgi:hypothetical protein
MRVYNIVILIVNTLLFLALGLLMIGTGANQAVAEQLVGFHTWLSGLVEASLSARVLMGSLGLIFVILAFSTIIGNIQNRRYERAVVIRGPLGDVMIALGAMEDMARVVKADVDALKDIKMRVHVGRKGLKVTARVVLYSDSTLPQATEQVQESIRRCFQDILGVEQELRPRVLVSKVVFRDPEEERGRDELTRARKRYPSSLV